MHVDQKLDDDEESLDSRDDDSVIIERPATTSNNDDFVIAKAETKALFWWKMVVLTVLLSSALGVAVAVYKYTSNSETNVFEEQFKNDAVKIFEAIGSTLDMSLGSVESFLVSVSSFVTYANMTWPFVTIVSNNNNKSGPFYEILLFLRVQYSYSLTCGCVNRSPIITFERRRYESYQSRSVADSIISSTLAKGKSGKTTLTKTMAGFRKV